MCIGTSGRRLESVERHGKWRIHMKLPIVSDCLPYAISSVNYLS